MAYKARTGDDPSHAHGGKGDRADNANRRADGREDEPSSLSGVLKRLKQHSEGDQASVGEMMSAFGNRSYGALITAIGLVAAMPLIGAIPGVSVITGLLIIMVIAQYLAGRENPYAPSFITERSIEREKFEKAIDKSEPYAAWVDKFLKQRLTFVVGGPVQRVVLGGVVIFLAATMVPLALVPWGVQPPATAIVLLGLALIARDGVMAILGYGLSAVTIYLLYTFSGTIASWFG